MRKLDCSFEQTFFISNQITVCFENMFFDRNMTFSKSKTIGFENMYFYFENMICREVEKKRKKSMRPEAQDQ